ncbi:MAG: hypothetical protein GY722_23655 [bacterium]|nr:hypothetical protein [bacterium]
MNIVQEERRLEYTGSNPSFQGKVALLGVFRVVPSNPDWPEIRVVFDTSFRFLEQVEFASWDGHEDDFVHVDEDDDRYGHSLRGTVSFIADLVQRRICVVEELDSDGEILTAEVLKSTEVSGELLKKTRVLRRVLFDREPRFEEIDYSRYVEWQDSMIEQDWAKEMGILDEVSEPSGRFWHKRRSDK